MRVLYKSVKYKFIYVAILLFLYPNENCAIAKNPSSKISAQAWKLFQNGEKTDVMINCKDQILSGIVNAVTFNDISSLLATSDTRNDPTGVQALTDLLTTYEHNSNLNFSPLVNLLRKLGLHFQKFWIADAVFVRGVTLAQAVKLAALDVVLFIRIPRRIPVPLPIGDGGHINPPPITSNDEMWNINLIDARCPGITNLGAGVIAGMMDTGVLWDHEQLIDSWVGQPYGWLNGTIEIQETPFPGDNFGHGTHCMGTIAGKTVGVAPGVTWLACTMGGEIFEEPAILKCGQWMAWPYMWNDTTADKVTRNVSMRPHVINNSWGGGGGSQVMNPLQYDPGEYKMYEMWNALGIVSPTAMGNFGPACGSGAVPANFDHILAVGAVNINATIATFSSRGPTITGKSLNKNSTAVGNKLMPPGGVASCTDENPIWVMVKPDIVAPGVAVTSSWSTSPTSYLTISGTSMATPHITATAALLISTRLNAGWNYKSIYTILTKTTNRDLIDLKGVGKSGSDSYARSSNVLCNFIAAGICDDWPNNVYGTGLVSACGAVKFANSLTLSQIRKLSRGEDVVMKSESKRFSFLDFI